MRVNKCDICKKVIKGESVGLSYSSANSTYRYRNMCSNCSKPVLAFIKQQGWWDEIEQSETRWTALTKYSTAI